MTQGSGREIFFFLNFSGHDTYPFVHMAGVQGQGKNGENTGGAERMAVQMYELQITTGAPSVTLRLPCPKWTHLKQGSDFLSGAQVDHALIPMRLLLHKIILDLIKSVAHFCIFDFTL